MLWWGAAGGDVMSVLFAALIGGFALGQAAPNLQYFSTGKVAGARVIGMISRCHAPLFHIRFNLSSPLAAWL